MKTSRYVAATAILFTSTALSTPAFAQKYNQFGNLAGVDDCQYETAANLILHQYPKSKITTNQVESAFDTFGDDWQGTQVLQSDGSWLNEGLWAGQNFLISQGFDGHRASSITQISQAQAVVDANHGGVEVVNDGPVRQHMFAMIAASRTRVVLVDDGFTYHYTWAWLQWAYTQSGETLTYYAVTWA